MAAYDPRPRLPPEADEPPAPRKGGGARPPSRPSRSRRRPRRPAASDITGKQRVELADQAIAYLDKALALRPHYADAMTYLGLSGGRSRSGCSPSPRRGRPAVDRANEWQRKALAARAGKS